CACSDGKGPKRRRPWSRRRSLELDRERRRRRWRAARRRKQRVVVDDRVGLEGDLHADDERRPVRIRLAHPDRGVADSRRYPEFRETEPERVILEGRQHRIAFLALLLAKAIGGLHRVAALQCHPDGDAPAYGLLEALRVAKGCGR